MKKDEYINQMKNISVSEDLIKKTISNIEQAKKVEKLQKQGKWKKVLATAAAMVTLSAGTVGAYVAISGNTEILEKLGIHISQNYEKNKQDINDKDYVQLSDGVEAKLVSASIDNTNLVMEIDLKLDKDIEEFNPDFKVNNVSIFMPARETEVSKNLAISEKCSSAKIGEGTWKIFKYISIKDVALGGNSFWSDIFYLDAEVDCKVEFLGLFEDDNYVTEFTTDNKVFEFKLKKPEDLKEVTNVDHDNLIKYNNITIDGYNVQQSDFGNIVGFDVIEKNIDINKVNDIQKVDFIIKDANGTRLNVVSKSENITVGDYSKGKLHKIGLEVQIVVDDASDNTNYTIEIVENDKINISTKKVKEIYDNAMNSYKSGEWALNQDGIGLLTSYLNEEDYYVDEYGVYRTYE